MSFSIRCQVCGVQVEADARPRCPNGHDRLEVVYAPSQAARSQLVGDGKEDGPADRGMWRFRALLPVGPETRPVTLGEGDTPLSHAGNLARRLGLERLYIKVEGTNPSGSFKDRCASVALTKAVEQGVSAVAIASAGNAAASASAYAARAGIDCWVFVPVETPRERVVQVLLSGGRVLAVEGSVNDCSDLVDRGAERFGWCPVTTAASKNLYQAEATRTLAFELWQQLGRTIPDWIVAPVGGGGLLSGIAKGWRELKEMGLTDRIPRLLAVQAQGCAPLVRAFQAGVDPDAIQPWGKPTSRVASIADPFPMDGSRLLRAMRAHGGYACAVTDEQALAAESSFALEEGLFVEPASATTLAAAKLLLMERRLGPEELIVLIATGVGFKDMGVAQGLVREAPRIPAKPEAMFKAVVEIGGRGATAKPS